MSAGGRGKHRGGMTPDGTKSAETINGYAVSYVQRINKCNNPRCKKCKEPGGGHGPYWYKIYRNKEGKVKTEYYGKVAPDDKDKGEND